MFGSLVPRTTGKFRTPSMLRDWEPFELLERFWEEGDGWTFGRNFMPPVDVVESEGGFEVSVELPGMKPEDVKVELLEGRLYISGEKKEEVEEKGKTFRRVERRHGEFRRVMPLPTNVDAEHVLAKFENGVLKVTLAKTEEAKPKHIEVTAV